MDVATDATGLKLTCRPHRENRSLVFDYSLVNALQRDVYVHDAMPSVDHATREVSANRMAVSVIHGQGGDAIVGKFLPPAPVGARPGVPITPLAWRLGPGETMERRLDVPEPLAETSPWLPDLLLRQYEEVEIPAVVFTIGYWISGGEGFGVMPCPYAEDLFTVVFSGPPSGCTVLVSQRFATRGLRIFRRTDDFPRTV